MARRARRKQNGVLGTLFVELSALMGILGIAQPSVRNNLWSIINPPSATSTQNAQGQVIAGSPVTSTHMDHRAQFTPQSQGQAHPQAVQQVSQHAYPQPYAAPTLMQFPDASAAYNSHPSPMYFAPTYAAQATLPLGAVSRPRWQASTYHPMGGYQ